jgi:vitamin B12 transporter
VQRRSDASWGSAYFGLRGERDGSLGGEFSPSAGVVVRLSSEASLKANAATAFRAPNADELYFPGFGNPALVPERAKVWDISIADSRIGGGGADVTWFTNRTNDLIAFNFTTSQLDQIDHASIEGFTFDLKTLPYHGITTTFNITNLYRAENLDAQTRLANDPVTAANLRLDYTSHIGSAFDGWGIALRIAGQRGTVNPFLPAFDQPVEYSTANAYVRFRTPVAAFTLRGFNLGNERYAAVSGYPMPGRSFVLEASTK